MTDKQAEMLPCPFCRRAALDASYDFTDNVRYYLVECSGCGASCAVHGTWEKAVKAWNTRPAPAPMDSTVKENLTVQKLPTDAENIKNQNVMMQDEWRKIFKACDDGTIPDEMREAISWAERIDCSSGEMFASLSLLIEGTTRYLEALKQPAAQEEKL